MINSNTGIAGRTGPAVIKLRLAVALGAALLVIGLVTGMLVAPSRVEMVPSPVPAVQAQVPALNWRDDYGTRHPGELP